MLKPKLFSVFEHRCLRLKDANTKGETFKVEDLQVLREYYGSAEKGSPYFSLGDECVWFREFVGVLQVGHLTIEVLPKADEAGTKEVWREKLIDMLRRVHQFEVSATSNTDLSFKCNNILEYYINLFLVEVEKLLHQGLIKKYRDHEENIYSLKGRLLFSKHFTKNIVHKERFYVNNTTYDRENQVNKILFKTLNLINEITNNSSITSKAGSLILDFPQMQNIQVSDDLFDTIQYNRKTEGYRTAISIARLLLLNYHPDIKRGRNDVIALMFDMNLLWERFVYAVLKRNLKDYIVHEQIPRPYWKLYGYRAVSLKPDIKLTKDNNHYIVDTKWKVLRKIKPAYQDLQQMFAYTKYFASTHTILLYPGPEDKIYNGFFYHEHDKDDKYPCSVGIIGLKVDATISTWEKKISEKIREYLKAEKSET